MPKDFSTDPMRKLLDWVNAEVALPGDESYAQVISTNHAAPVQPCAVVFATTAHDIAQTVRFAAANGRRVAVQATCYNAALVGGETIVVHTSLMSTCSVDTVDRRARVGAGTQGQSLVDTAAPHGLTPLCGSAPGASVVGHLTGDGIGPLVRTAGLSSDHVRSFVLVTGVGDILQVTPHQHSDLFWGVRGGKSRLGIVTEVEMDLLPIAEFYGGALYFEGAQASAVVHAWRRWCSELPEDINTSIVLQKLPRSSGIPHPMAGKRTVVLRYTAVGDVAAAQQRLAPMRAVADPILDTVGILPCAALGTVHANPVDPMPATEGDVFLHELTAEAVDVLLGLAAGGSSQIGVELRLLGGALARKPEHRSAFCHRDAAVVVSTVDFAGRAECSAAAADAAALVAAMSPWSTHGQLANFGASSDPGWPTQAYSEDTHVWLQALAEHYDPMRVLWTRDAPETE